MSEETPSQSPDSPEASASDAPRIRRISNARPKKAARPAQARKLGEADAPAAAKESAAYPVFDLSEAPAIPRPAPEESASSGDWPEPEPATAGEAAAPEGPKRGKRRRGKKGKGGGQQNAPQAENGAPAPPAVAESAAPQASQPRPVQAQRPKFDPDALTKLAWKIYLSEVSEEGVALIGDNDAKELSRRCFRLAEIFMEEQSRRR